MIKMSEVYGRFAYIYDDLMSCVNYPEWVDYIEEIFRKNNVSPKLVLELGCGTGSVCIEMAKRGYNMIGADLSEDMLNVALSKASKEDLDILFLHQDMREFELYGTVDAIVCVMDSINYITAIEDLNNVFGLVKNYLNPGGIFIFDINTRYKLEEILGNNTFVADEENVFYVWENAYNKDKGLCEFMLTFFVKNQGKYTRIDECHQQKAYTIEAIQEALVGVGLTLTNMYEALTFGNPIERSERIFFTCVRGKD